MSNGRNWCTLSGNQELARRIVAYWYDRGHVDVEVRVELLARTQGDPLYGVRSNLMNGMPPR
jgi:hypothetical protein